MPTRSIRPHLVVASSVMAMGLASGVAAIVAHAETPYEGASTAATGPSVPGHVLVRFNSTVGAAAQAAVESANGAHELSTIPALQTHVLSVPVGAEQHVIDALERSGKVQYAELDGLGQVTTTPNDPDWSQQWGPAKINAATAWNTTTGSSSIIIADLDTGIDLTHPDLAGKTVAGYDFYNNDSDPTDDNGHGTSTAGIIGAASNNGIGVAGMCWACKIMPVKVASSSGSVPWSAVASGITWATDHGARAINMSFGGTGGSSTLQSAVQYALDHNVVLVAAAGNNGNSTPEYPADYPGVLSVAGTTSSDTLYSWSNYGSWVAVAAPGCDYSTAMGGGYTSGFCGTSAATPVVTGLVGLLESAQPTATQAAIVSAIESSAVSIGSSVAYGRVNAAGAMTAIGSAPASSPSPTPTSSPTSSPSPSPTPTSTPTTSPTSSPSPSPTVTHGHSKK